jgi:integrase
MLPAAAPPREAVAYSLEQIRAMIAALPDSTSRVMVAVAAFTGLSRSEIRGLTWEAWQGDELHVLRSIVAGRVQDTKTRARKAPVPLLPSLAKCSHSTGRMRGTTLPDRYFEQRTGRPLILTTCYGKGCSPRFVTLAFRSGRAGMGCAVALHRICIASGFKTW